MPYSRVELLQAVRADHPEFKDVDDNRLFAAIAVDHPDVAKGISELQAPAAKPQGSADEVLGPLMVGVDPMSFAKRIGGAVAAVVNPLLPGGDTRNPKITQPEMSPDEEIGAKAAAVAPAIELGAGLAGSLKSEAAARYLRNQAEINLARALKPTTLETKAITERIAPELMKRVDPQLTGRGIDDAIETQFQKAKGLQRAAEDRVINDPRPEYQIATEPIVGQIKGAITKLKVRGTNVSGHPEAISALEKLQGDIEGLPKYADPDQVIQLRRQYDQAIEEAGGFKDTGTAADRVALKAKKGVADLLRGSINDLDPNLKAANHDYSLFSDARQVVRRRQLGDIGNGEKLISSGGGILDDILLGWAGNALGGTPGGMIAEGANIIRRTRGVSAVKSAVQRTLADQLEPNVPERLRLTEGQPRLNAPPDTSGVTGSPADLAVSGRPRMLTAGARQMPAAPDASSVTATNVGWSGSPIRARLGPKADRVIAVPIEGPTGPPGGYPMRAPIRGLIPEQAGPATSGSPVRGSLPAHREPIITPTPDGSSLEVVDAQKQIARDPKTGRMFKYYTSARTD